MIRRLIARFYTAKGAAPGADRRAIGQEFRSLNTFDTCKKIDPTPLGPCLAPPDAWTRAACFAFALATLYALAVVALRLPAWRADHRDAFRVALLLHVNLAVFVWLVLTMAGQWARSLGAVAWRWPLLAAVGGTVSLAGAPLVGGAPVMADYFPWLADNPLFAFGMALVSTGVLALAGQRLWHGAEPSVAALRLAAWQPVMAALAAAAARLNGGDGIAVAWAAGHTLLFGHVAMLCHEWTQHGGGEARRAVRAIRLLVAASAVLVVLPFCLAPGTAAYRHAYSLSMIGVLWLPPLYVGLGLLGRRRRRGPSRGALPAVSRFALLLSLALLALGGLLGLAIALDGRSTTLVTAHYHAAVGAVAISRMGIAYLHTGNLAHDPARWPMIRGQLAVYAGALVLLTAGLTLAAVEGAPRKTSAAELAIKGPWYRAGMTVAGLGGTLAMAGTVWLLFNLLGARRPAANAVAPSPLLPLPRREVPHES